jgi:hypothetical protein
MKIAIVLRGIPRYRPYDLGRKLLDKLIIERFSDCEFRVIAQIPTLVEDTKLLRETNCKSVFAAKILSADDCKEVINAYRPDYYICNTFVETFEAAKYYITQKHGKIDNINKIHDTFILFNDLCQHVNYLHSKKALITYANENKWYPDLILNTRYDLIHFFESDLYMITWQNHINSINSVNFNLRPIQAEFNNQKIEQYVYPNIIEYYKDKVWMSDWSFFETWSEQYITGSAEFDVMKQALNLVSSPVFEKYALISSQTAHFYWHCVFENCIIRSLPVTDCSQQTVLIRNSNPTMHEELLNITDLHTLKNKFNEIAKENKNKMTDKIIKKPSEDKIMEMWNFYTTMSEEILK